MALAHTAPRPAAEDPFGALDRSIFAHRSELAGLARREGLAAEDAVDAVQDAFSKLLQLVLQGRAPDGALAVRAYLFEIVRNTARNQRRLHRNARRHEALEAVPEPATAYPSGESLIAEAEEHVRLRACVDRLCDTQRAVVTLRMLEERPGEDVAERLGISRGYVDVLLHRAKGSLKACLLEPGAP